MRGAAGTVELSVIVPVFNEHATVALAVARVLEVFGAEVEVLLVDDGSDARCAALLEQIAASDARVTLLRHTRNRGKGAAVRLALASARGSLAVVQDSDLEYDPADLAALLEVMADESVDLALGDRFARGDAAAPYAGHRLANRLLTGFHNLVTGARLSDLHCCYKVYRTAQLRHLGVREDRFGVDPELMAKAAARGLRVVEVPVGYAPRGYEDGKKVGPRDALRSLYCGLRYGALPRVLRRASP